MSRRRITNPSAESLSPTAITQTMNHGITMAESHYFHFNDHFPGRSGSAGASSPQFSSSTCSGTEPLQRDCIGRMPFLSPNQRCKSTEGNSSQLRSSCCYYVNLETLTARPQNWMMRYTLNVQPPCQFEAFYVFSFLS